VDPVLAGILLASLALKLGLAVWAESLQPRNDEATYVLMAEALEQGRSPGRVRPPGYPALIAAVRSVGGELSHVRLLQALLSAVTTLFVYALGRSVGGTGTARLAAAVFAFDPVLVGFSHLLWTETLFIFLFFAGLWLLLVPFDPARHGRWLAAGALFGLAAWVRPQMLAWLPFLFAWLGWRERSARALRAGLLLAAGFAAVVLPDTLHHLASQGRFRLISSTGSFNLLVGTAPSAAFVDKDDHWQAGWGQLPGGGYEEGAALRIAWLRASSQPLHFLRKCLWEAAHLWTLDSFVLRHLRNGWYGDDLPPWLLPAAVLGTGLFSALLLLAGWLGWVALPPSPFRGLAGLTLLYAVLLFGATFSLSRYAVPFRPLLAVSAAWLLRQPEALPASLRARRGAALLAAAGLALLAASWWNDAPLLWDMLRSGGAGHRFRWLEPDFLG
jgi:4-amino-4-deoxy-L-arabinose transferase-like glycosyltransferase